MHQLRERIAEVPQDREVAVYSESGYRSAIAMGILEQEGPTNAVHIVGGIAAWQASQLETVS